MTNNPPGVQRDNDWSSTPNKLPGVPPVEPEAVQVDAVLPSKDAPVSCFITDF